MQKLSLWEESPRDLIPHALFLALRPDDQAIDTAEKLMHRLRRQRLRLRRPLEGHRLHVTLCGLGQYVGQVPPHLLADTDAAVTSLRAAPFIIAFDRLHGANGHLLLRPSSATALQDFGARLRTALIRAGLRKWLRWRFSPHMTLAYDAENMPESTVDPVTWKVRDFVLVESLQGPHIHIRRGAWTLTAPAAHPAV